MFALHPPPRPPQLGVDWRRLEVAAFMRISWEMSVMNIWSRPHTYPAPRPMSRWWENMKLLRLSNISPVPSKPNWAKVHVCTCESFFFNLKVRRLPPLACCKSLFAKKSVGVLKEADAKKRWCKTWFILIDSRDQTVPASMIHNTHSACKVLWAFEWLQHNAAQLLAWATSGFCWLSHRGEERRVTRWQWQSCHGRKVWTSDLVLRYFRIYINILNTTLHSSWDIWYAEKEPTFSICSVFEILNFQTKWSCFKYDFCELFSWLDLLSSL